MMTTQHETLQASEDDPELELSQEKSKGEAGADKLIHQFS